MKISIAIPAYNEEKTIIEVVDRVKDLKIPLEKEIIVVDDGSTDKSYEKIKNVKGIRVLRHSKNLGKGAAIKTALKDATGEFFVVQDADLELSPEQISKIIEPILKREAEVVYGSRNWGENTKDSRSPLFYFGGLFITFITNLLFNIKLTDEPCGFKCFRTNILRSIKINSNRFEWEPEVTAKIARKKIKIHEVPIISSSRSLKQGKKLKRRDGIKAFLTLFKYRFLY